MRAGEKSTINIPAVTVNHIEVAALNTPNLIGPLI